MTFMLSWKPELMLGQGEGKMTFVSGYFFTGTPDPCIHSVHGSIRLMFTSWFNQVAPQMECKLN